MEDYEKNARAFLERHGATLTIKRSIYQGRPLWAGVAPYGIHYLCEIKRPSRMSDNVFRFSFWDSVANKEEGKRPTVYDVLSCLTKYDPETMEDFVNNYGYDPEDPRTERTYKAVVREWLNIDQFFGDCLDDLREIA